MTFCRGSSTTTLIPQGSALSSDSAIERESMSFSTNIDVDYDIAKAGISRKRFRDEYIKWIK